MQYTIKNRSTESDSKYSTYSSPMFTMDIWKKIGGKPNKPQSILTIFNNEIEPIAVFLSRKDASYALRKFKAQKRITKA